MTGVFVGPPFAGDPRHREKKPREAFALPPMAVDPSKSREARGAFLGHVAASGGSCFRTIE
ncbi:MAG TPA: hypothetical protein ENN35_02725 [Deltaproteobacteria bacterium]|nr:hypothetical protein [Deltaproteobacteria bacterium]